MFRTSRLWQKLFRSPLSTSRKQVRGQTLARASISKKRYLPQLEILEDRLAPATATINVTSTSATPNYQDTTVMPSALAGQNNVTLRDAINAADNFGATPGNSTIINLQNTTYTFTNAPATTGGNITTTQPYWWYGPDALPVIDSTVTINGNGATLQISSGGTSLRLSLRQQRHQQCRHPGRQPDAQQHDPDRRPGPGRQR